MHNSSNTILSLPDKIHKVFWRKTSLFKFRMKVRSTDQVTVFFNWCTDVKTVACILNIFFEIKFCPTWHKGVMATFCYNQYVNISCLLKISIFRVFYTFFTFSLFRKELQVERKKKLWTNVNAPDIMFFFLYIHIILQLTENGISITDSQ